MTLRLIFAVVLLSMLSCGKKDYPGELLPQPKMELVMWDMLQTEAIVRERMKTDSSGTLEDSALHWQAAVFKKHNVLPEDYYGSLEYYIDHESGFIQLLDSVMKRKPEKFKAPREREPRRNLQIDQHE